MTQGIFLSVLTLNCQRGHRLEALKVYLQDLLASQSTDFLLLQEMNARCYELLRRLRLSSCGYSLLDWHNNERGQRTETCILFKTTHKLLSSEFFTFDSLLRAPHEKGALFGTFLVGKRRVLVCSLHLHAGRHARARRTELRALKKRLLEQKAGLLIVGGDFNNMLPREFSGMRRALSPEFSHVTHYREHSHDSRHVEPLNASMWALGKLGKLGVGRRSKMDHVFLDSGTAGRMRCETTVHDVLVSDHRPVELRIFLD
jgi:endonuclease/exonuclease/phosphatase family metal-dependent hydrolase